PRLHDMSNDYFDDVDASYEPGLYDRWRPALFAFAVLLTVVAIAVLRNSSSNESTNGSNPDVVVDSSGVPRVTVPLTRTLRDGVFGQNTLQAVWAFEKLVLDTPREDARGEVTPSIWSIMESDLKIQPRRVPDSPRHVEIDLVKQVMIVFQGGTPTLITHMSSGSNEKWCEEVTIDPGEDGNNTREQIKKGICGDAITPPGIFYFYNRKQGMRESKLGTMYNPVYFNYGIAVHGAILVPLEPASHGCVRIPMSVARYFPALVEYGDRVYVFDGIKEPEEYGSPPPPWDRPDPNYTTTTSIAPTTTLKGAPTTTVPPTTLP
ncbi:MAG: hypothetical protein RLZ74_101, partial [Actinomycetota bacterium]